MKKRCIRCGGSDGVMHDLSPGRYICDVCLRRWGPKQKVVIIGKDLWDRYMAADAEAKQREKLLQYLLDKDANISDATQMSLCDQVISARLALDAVSHEIQNIAMNNGSATGSIRFGPKAYQITIETKGG